jgi:hypothetical protein
MHDRGWKEAACSRAQPARILLKANAGKWEPQGELRASALLAGISTNSRIQGRHKDSWNKHAQTLD